MVPAVSRAGSVTPEFLPLSERILQLTGIDILRCPVCGEGPMHRIERLAPDMS
jgi:hypothetical protein